MSPFLICRDHESVHGGRNRHFIERADWERFHAETSAAVRRLASEILDAERAIDRLVYEAFELTPEEIALLEGALDGSQ